MFCGTSKQTQRLHDEIAELRNELKVLGSKLESGGQATATKGSSFVSTSFPVSGGVTASSFQEATPGSILAQPANEIVAHVWPQVSHWATEFLLKEVNPAIQAALPESLAAHIDPDRCHLGHEAVKFSSIKIFDRKERTPTGFCDNIVFRCRMEWNGDPSIFLQVAGTSAGVHGLTLRGHLLVELVHMLPYPPMFQGVRLFFLDPPDLQLHFGGIGSDLLNVNMVQRRIIKVFQSELASRVVAPKFMGFKMVNTDIFAITSPSPEGILRVTVHNASQLLPMDVNFFGKGTSDPYVQIRCGASVLKSETFFKQLNPEFKYVASMPISSLHDQNIWVEVFDHDTFSRDDFLGKVSLPVDLLATWGKQKKVTVQLRNEKGEKGKNGSVTLSAEWQPLRDAAGEHHCAVIDVGIYSALNLPNLGPYAKYWITGTCSQLMPCAPSEPQSTEQQYALKVHATAEVDDSEVPRLHLLKDKKDLLKKRGLSNKEICKILELEEDADLDNLDLENLKGLPFARWRRSIQFLAQRACDAEITFTLMAQGDGQKPLALGSFTRHMGEVIKAEGFFYKETVRLPETEILLHIKIQLHDLAETAVAGKPERQTTYRTDALGDTHSVTSL